MLKKIKEFFMGKPVDVVAPGSAPYKVPEPAAATPIPLVVETAPVVEAAPVVETAPAVTATPEKKVRKPRTPKAEKAVVEKAPAKAKATKLTVIKTTKLKKA